MQKYGRLTVRGSSKKEGRIFFYCLCDCGKTKLIYNRSVINGYSKSCGCLKSELSSKRMQKNNPVHMLGVKARMIQTNKRLGTRPKVRGGNGTEMPIAQRTLLAALGVGWYAEHSVVTKLRGKTKEKYPTCYKIDVAHPQKMIGIEVDGSSHNLISRKNQDRKKDRFLSLKGWTIYRFKNDQIMNNLNYVIKQIR